MKGLLILSHNIEDGEALFTRALLKRAGFDMVTLTFESSKHIQTAFGLNVQADAFLDEIDPNTFDFVVVPGGKYVAQIVDRDQHIKGLVKTFYQKKKLVAAICAGPRFLGQAGLLDDKKFTCFTGCDIDMKGTYLKDLKAVRDGNIITARGAGAIYEFVFEVVKYFQGEDKAKALLDQVLY